MQENFAELRRVVELIRVSSEWQPISEWASIPDHKAANRRTAARYGLDIVDTIVVVADPQTPLSTTLEIRQLLDLLVTSEIHGVVMKELSCLLRPGEFIDFIVLEAFEKMGTVLYLPDGAIDFGTQSGRFFGTIRAVIEGFSNRGPRTVTPGEGEEAAGAQE